MILSAVILGSEDVASWVSEVRDGILILGPDCTIGVSEDGEECVVSLYLTYIPRLKSPEPKVILYVGKSPDWRLEHQTLKDKWEIAQFVVRELSKICEEVRLVNDALIIVHKGLTHEIAIKLRA